MEREKIVDGFLHMEYKQKEYGRIAQDLVDNFIDLRVPLRVWAQHSTFKHPKGGRHEECEKKRFERPMVLHSIFIDTLISLCVKLMNPEMILSTLATRRARLDDRSAYGYGLGV